MPPPINWRTVARELIVELDAAREEIGRLSRERDAAVSRAERAEADREAFRVVHMAQEGKPPLCGAEASTAQVCERCRIAGRAIQQEIDTAWDALHDRAEKAEDELDEALARVEWLMQAARTKTMPTNSDTESDPLYEVAQAVMDAMVDMECGYCDFDAVARRATQLDLVSIVEGTRQKHKGKP